MSHELPSFLIDAGELLQHVSRVVYRGSPLYYGRSSTNRYDDPAQAYGVLYLGRDPFSQKVYVNKSRMVRAVGVMDDVLLADLTAPGVMAGYFGLNLEQLASRDYTHTQQVSAQVHAMLGDDGQVLFDGVLYPSRNNYPAKSIALFERASAKVSVIEDIDLVDHVDWPRFVATYRIGVEPDPGPLEPDDEAS